MRSMNINSVHATPWTEFDPMSNSSEPLCSPEDLGFIRDYLLAWEIPTVSNMYLVLALFGLWMATMAIRRIAARRRSMLPPGPTGLPLIGNLLDMPKGFEWLTYQKWSRQYNSDLIYLNVMGTHIVVVNSIEAANELFEKRSSLYSDRICGIMMNELIGWDFNLAFMPYSDRWRDSRRVFHQYYNLNQLPNYHWRIDKGTKELLVHLLEDPERYMEHVRHMTGSLIMRLTYGIDVASKNDPYITVAERALISLAAAGNAGSFVVDFIPPLKHIPTWFPGAGFKRRAREWRKYVVAMAEMPFNAVKEALSRGEAVPSMLASLLDELDENEDNLATEDIYRAAAGTAYTGGADTTVSAIGTFFLVMLLNPDVQKKAQDELDRVVGNDRLPAFEDESSLPYVSAVVKEIMRWRLVTNLAVPHRLTTDDEYKGYHLPAGTLVVGNAWAILHDEIRYPQPDRFYPERFLNDDGTFNSAAPDPMEAAFGFGRRICPGRYLAMADVWLTVASILATFNIKKAVDESGRILEPSGDYTPGLISYPVAFYCDIKPRHSEAEKLVREWVE